MSSRPDNEPIRVYEVIDDDDDDDDYEPVVVVKREQEAKVDRKSRRTLGKRKAGKQKDAPNVKRRKTPTSPTDKEGNDESVVDVKEEQQVVVKEGQVEIKAEPQRTGAPDEKADDVRSVVPAPRRTGTTERATAFGKAVDVWLDSGEWPDVHVRQRNGGNVVVNCGFNNFMCAGIGTGSTVIVNGRVVSGGGGRYMSGGGTVEVGRHVVPFDVNQVPCLYIEGNARDVTTSSGDVVVWGRSDNIKTASGDVTVDGNALDLNTASGDLRVRGRGRSTEDPGVFGPPEHPSGNLLIHVHGAVRNIYSGSLDVHIDGKVNTLKTASGDVEVGGDAKDITTVSGDITVRGRCRNKSSAINSGFAMSNVSINGMTFGNIFGGRFR